ncbi:hypothetical protein [Streptomyces sp. NPDC050528]|uniref:hypothetical protein n=1 Tax=Streptomyces sp. NPDC050528 TaxID=3365623 RepID=UPI003797A0CB
MTENRPGTTLACARFLLVAMAAGPLALTACGSQGSDRADTSSVPRSPATAAATPTPASSGTVGALNKAAQDAAAQRAAAAPSGDPVRPTNTAVPDPEDYGFGKAAATAAHGEVVAYTPRLVSGRVVVPLTFHNSGDERVAYTVTVTVVGGGRKSPFTVVEKAGDVWPDTTWPTQADITASGATTGTNDTRISLKVVQNDPFADTN